MAVSEVGLGTTTATPARTLAWPLTRLDVAGAFGDIGVLFPIAIALAMGLSPSAIASAGVLMGILLAIIAVTNTAALLAKLFTLPIVRGIQLGLGLLLAREGLRLVLGRQSILALSNG